MLTNVRVDLKSAGSFPQESRSVRDPSRSGRRYFSIGSLGMSRKKSETRQPSTNLFLPPRGLIPYNNSPHGTPFSRPFRSSSPAFSSHLSFLGSCVSMSTEHGDQLITDEDRGCPRAHTDKTRSKDFTVCPCACVRSKGAKRARERAKSLPTYRIRNHSRLVQKRQRICVRMCGSCALNNLCPEGLCEKSSQTAVAPFRLFYREEFEGVGE